MARKNTRSNDNPDTSLAAPQTRKERFLAKAAGLVAQAPIGQYNRLERYLQAIIERLDAGFYPSEAQLAAINSGATEAKINSIETKLPQYGMGKNLLRNAYFVGGGSQKGYGTFPINQRDVYVVPADVTYYSDTALTTSAGTTSAYTTVTKVNATYGSIDVSGTTYYVAMSDAVPGYVGNGYGIDGWKYIAGNSRYTLENNGLHLTSYAAANGIFDQIIQNPSQYNGKIMTFSLLTDIEYGGFGLQAFSNVISTQHDNGLHSITGVGLIDVGAGVPSARFFASENSTSATIIAAKLEEGNTQTLAHQENGVWVLNEVPDYGEELRRCQEWQQEINLFDDGFCRAGSGQAATTTKARINVPLISTMRVKPIIIVRGNWGLETLGVSGLIPVESITSDRMSSNILTIECTVKSGNSLTVGGNYTMLANADNFAKLLLDANP